MNFPKKMRPISMNNLLMNSKNTLVQNQNAWSNLKILKE